MQKKRDKELKAKSTQIVVKEIRFGPQTDEHDYDFKRKNGVTEEYIQQKEKDLIGIMHSVSLGWYTNKLSMVGFKSVEVIHGDLGFVTFLCSKTNGLH